MKVGAFFICRLSALILAFSPREKEQPLNIY
jgi:hypothetical protein